MLIQFKKLLDYGVTPKGVIHVGMHIGEEYETYKESGVDKIIFIEANSELAFKGFDKFSKDPNCQVINAAISDKEEMVEFTITNNGESSSILPLQDHALIYPSIVPIKKILLKTKTLDSLLSNEYCEYNILNLDIQGAELKAMKGFSNWSFIDAIFTEVNYREMYLGCSKIEEIERFLLEKGFKLVEQVDTGAGWGDALFVKI